jgi:uncharacterized protein
MLPTRIAIEALHHKYAPNDTVYELVFGHCQIVADIAQWCVNNGEQTNVDRPLLEVACLLHDIGTYAFFDAAGKVFDNRRLYKQHAMFGATIVANEGIDQRVAEIIETHVLMGITKQEILDNKWALPTRDFTPKTIEAELLCYADRFHSKEPIFNSYDTFLSGLSSELPEQAKKFEVAAQRFGIPDIAALAERYQQPIR